MTNSHEHLVSARIYEFPKRGRYATKGARDESKTASAFAPRSARVAIGNSWYHEEAIREAEIARDK